jgi:hypothetical protein
VTIPPIPLQAEGRKASRTALDEGGRYLGIPRNPTLPLTSVGWAAAYPRPEAGPQTLWALGGNCGPTRRMACAEVFPAARQCRGDYPPLSLVVAARHVHGWDGRRAVGAGTHRHHAHRPRPGPECTGTEALRHGTSPRHSDSTGGAARFPPGPAVSSVHPDRLLQRNGWRRALLTPLRSPPRYSRPSLCQLAPLPSRLRASVAGGRCLSAEPPRLLDEVPSSMTNPSTVQGTGCGTGRPCQRPVDRATH